MQISVEPGFLYRLAGMDRKRAEARTAHTLCKKPSQTRRAAATRRFAVKLSLILLWLLIYLLHMLWLPSCFARLPLSLCFSSTATHGLLLLSLFESRAVPLFHLPGSSSRIQPSPPHHRQLPPMLDFNFLLMSSFSPAHGSCIMSWKTLLCSRLCKGVFAGKQQFYSLCTLCPISFADFLSYVTRNSCLCWGKPLYWAKSLPFLKTDLSVTPVALKSPGVKKTSLRNISSIRLYFYIHKEHLDPF